MDINPNTAPIKGVNGLGPSPLLVAIEARGLTRRQFALAIGKPYSSTANAISGYQALPASWRFPMEAIGMNFHEIQAAQKRYMEALGQAVRQQLAAQG